MADIESIVREHGKRLYNLAYRICGDAELAEDLYQESLIAINQALPSFRGESTSFTWAYRITTRTCLRKRGALTGDSDARAALRRADHAGHTEGDEEYAIETLPSDGMSPEEKLVHDALMAEIREKCHYFVTFS